jgi:transmembrane sensor
MFGRSDSAGGKLIASAERDARAADWVARRDRGELTTEEHSAWQAWIAEDPRQHGAYLRAEAAWARLAQTAPGQAVVFNRRRLLYAGGAAAAAVPLALGARMALNGGAERAYASATGEILELVLAPGVAVKLDAQSRLRVRSDARRTRIALDGGRVWLDVASSAAPVVLKAASVELTSQAVSLGAAREADRLSLLVASGGARARADRDLAIEPLTKVSFSAGRYLDAQPVAQEAIDQARAWTEGRLIFDGETVAEAADAFNRYNRLQIKVVGPVIARRRVVGYFRLDDPQAFCAAVVASFGAQVIARPGALVLQDVRTNA